MCLKNSSKCSYWTHSDLYLQTNENAAAQKDLSTPIIVLYKFAQNSSTIVTYI